MSTSRPSPEYESAFQKKKDDIRTLYTKHMLHWGFGYPLYEPPSTNGLKIGQCGYFHHGVWNPIAFLLDADSVRAAGLQPMQYEAPRPAIDDSIRWGPQTSKSVRTSDSKVLVSATALVSGGAVEGSIDFSLDDKMTFGAVLATETPVRREMYHELSAPWNQWVADNEAALVKRYASGIKNGLWIVLQTYSTSKAHITVLNASKQTTKLGFKINLEPLGKVSPQGSWSTDYDMGGWAEYSSKVGCESLVGRRVTFYHCLGRRRPSGLREWIGLFAQLATQSKMSSSSFSFVCLCANRPSWNARRVTWRLIRRKRTLLGTDVDVNITTQFAFA